METTLIVLFIFNLIAIVLFLYVMTYFFYKNHKNMKSFWSLLQKIKLDFEKRGSVKEEDPKNSENTNRSASRIHTCWLWSFMILAFILSAISIVLHFSDYKPVTGEHVQNILVAITAVCATFIVCFQIYNSIEYRTSIKEFDLKHQNAVAEIERQRVSNEKTVKKLEQHSKDLIKSDGHSSRMVSFLLLEAKKPTWAMGWICRSMIKLTTYYDIDNKKLPDSYDELKDQSLLILERCIDEFVNLVNEKRTLVNTVDAITSVVKEDNLEDKNIVIRAFKDLVDFRINNSRSEHILFLERKSQQKKISAYISLMQEVLNEDELHKCNKLSRFQQEKNIFENEYKKCKFEKENTTEDTIERLFTELASLCPKRTPFHFPSTALIYRTK